MLPFIVALIFAVGLPLLPSSLYRALHLPTLKLNLLSARHAPEQVSVSSPEMTLLLESGYPEIGPDAGGSSQYLFFPEVDGADCLNDAATAPICMSLMEKQDYPEPSIWDAIHAQLLYQLAEATIIIALSFFVTTTFLSRRYLCIFVERLCTALFISRHYSLKAAFSSFLQDIFSGLHQYWMYDSVSKGQTPMSVTKDSQQAALEVAINTMPGEGYERDTSVTSLVSVSNLQSTVDLTSLDKSSLVSGSSSSGSITLPDSTNVSSAIDPASSSLLETSTRPLCNSTDISQQGRSRLSLGTCVERYPPSSTQPEVPGPNSDACLPVASSPPISSTTSFPSISMDDLYKSSRLIIAPTLLLKTPESEVSVSDPSSHSHSSSGHESLGDTNSTTTNPRPPSESNSTSSLALSQGSRRRYKSDGIQVLATRCHLGDTTSLLDPAKVDVTCAFWNDVPQAGERRVEKEPPMRLPRSLPPARIRRNTSEQAQNNPSAADAALAGLVATASGELIVPASQRPDGSMRKEIRLRPGYALRETFAEKYLPPAARRRTSTWNPLSREYSMSSPSPPQRHDSPLPSTPRGFRQRSFVHQSNSPAAQSDNWRRPYSANAPPPAIVSKATEIESSPSPVAVETPRRDSPPEVSLQECTAPAKTEAIASTPMITMFTQTSAPTVDQNAPIRPVDHLPHPPATLDRPTEKVTAPVKAGAEASESADITNNDPDNLENQRPEVPSPTRNTSIVGGREGRSPLRDITFTFSAPRLKAASEYLALCPPTTVETPAIFSHISDIFTKDQVLKTPTRTNEDFDRAIRETALNSPRKRRPSLAESNVPCSSVPAVFRFKASDASSSSSMSTPAHPNRIPRARRSAPHLGKYTGKQQQQQQQHQQGKVLPRAAQTPDGLKRRRMRTASSRGVENWTTNLASATPVPAIDYSGQIVLPAGMGWKGRMLTAAGQTPHHQRFPTAIPA